MKTADVPAGRLSSASERLRTRRMSDSMRLPVRPQFPQRTLGYSPLADQVRRPMSGRDVVMHARGGPRETVGFAQLSGRTSIPESEPRAAPLGAMLLATAVQSLNRADALLMDAHRRTASRTAAYQANLQSPRSPQGPGSPNDARSAASQIAQVLAEVEQQQEPIWGLFSERTTVLGGFGPVAEGEPDVGAEVEGPDHFVQSEGATGTTLPIPPLDPAALTGDRMKESDEPCRIKTNALPSPQAAPLQSGYGPSSGNPSPSSLAGRTPTTARWSDRPSPRTIESETRRTHIQELVRAAHEERRRTESGPGVLLHTGEMTSSQATPRASATSAASARPSILEFPPEAGHRKRVSSASWVRQPTPPDRCSQSNAEVPAPVDTEVDAGHKLINEPRPSSSHLGARSAVVTPAQSQSTSLSDSTLLRQPSSYFKRRNLVLIGPVRGSRRGSIEDGDVGDEKDKSRLRSKSNFRRLTEAEVETENQGKYRLLEQVQRELNDKIGLRFPQLAQHFHDKPPPPVPSYTLLHPVEFMEVADWEELPSSLQQWFIVRRFNPRE